MTVLMLDNMTADERVAMAFDLIRSAAMLLTMFPYREAAADLRRQEDMAWFTNPTLMQRHGKDDLRRKLRLLDAAAAFVAEWEAVKAEALPASRSDTE